MSLPFISETAAEVHRLAIAGSSLAVDDYRLKKLVPSLEGLAAKSPVFGKLASAVNAVVSGADPAASGRSLLDLSSLLTAIQYTQSPHEVKGELVPLASDAREWVPTTVSHRSLSAVIEALTSTGQGRMEVVRDALERGLFKDLRLMKPALDALHDNYGELSEFVAREVIPQFGPAIIGMLVAGFDPKGGKPHARRVTALCAIDPQKGREFCRKALETANKEVKLAVIEGLTGSQEDLETILDLTRERSAEVRKAAILALKGMKDARVVELVKKALEGTDALEAADVAASLEDSSFLEYLLERAQACLDLEPNERSERLVRILQALRGSREPRVFKALLQINEVMSGKNAADYSSDCRGMLVGALYELNSAEADKVLIGSRNGLCFGMAAAARRMDAEELFELFGNPCEKSADWLAYSLLLQGQTLRSGQRGGVDCPGLPPDKVSTRWVAVGIKKEDTNLVAALARPGDTAALKFLLAADAKELKSQAYYSFRLAPAIVRLDPENAPKYLVQAIESQQKKQPQYAYWGSSLFALIAALPATKIPELESLAVNLAGPWKERFDECLAQIRHRASESSNS